MILKSFVLIEKQGHFLLIKEAARKWKGKWFLPGGKVEENELPETAAHREVREEAGCTINIKGIFYFRYTKDFFDQHLSIFYSASITGEEVLKQVADKHSLDVRWFTYDEITQLSLRQDLLDILKNYNTQELIPVTNFKLFP